jgi:hypothetical protein
LLGKGGALMVAEQTQIWYRVSRRSPCQMCGGSKYCEVSADGRTIHCMKVGDGPESPYRGGGWFHQMDGAQVGPLPEPEPQPERGDADLLHRVYRCILDNAPLSADHRTYLIGKCGLPADAPTHGFGTLTPEGRNDIVGALRDEFTEGELLTVPGIILEQHKRQLTGRLTFANFGMLVAAKNVTGQIVGMQVRIGPGDYRWLSGCGGPSSGAPVHVARPSVVRDPRVYVAEAPKTAEVLAERLGAIVIGLAGFGNWRAAQPALEALAGEAEGLVIALDAADPADEVTAKRLANARTGLAALAVAIGYGVRLADWPYDAGKGPDDVLVNGNTWTLTVYKPTSSATDSEEAAALGKNADTLMAQFRAEAAAMSRSRLEQEYVRTVYNGKVSRDTIQLIGRIAGHQTMRELDKGGKGKQGRPLLSATDRVNGVNLVLLLRDAAHGGLCTQLTSIYRQAISDLGRTSVASVTQSAALLNALSIVVQEEAEGERAPNRYRLPDVMPSANPQGIDVSALEPVARKRRRTMRPCPDCGSFDLEEARTRRIICRGCGTIVSEHEDFKKVNGPDPDRERLAARDRAAARKHRGHSDWDAAMVPASDDAIEGTPSDPLVLHSTPPTQRTDEGLPLHSTRSEALNDHLSVVNDNTRVNATEGNTPSYGALSVVNDNTRVRRGPPSGSANQCPDCGVAIHWNAQRCDACRNEAASVLVGGW